LLIYRLSSTQVLLQFRGEGKRQKAAENQKKSAKFLPKVYQKGIKSSNIAPPAGGTLENSLGQDEHRKAAKTGEFERIYDAKIGGGKP